MTELAFDSSGEPFELPATAAFWRVRRFRNAGARGGPEVVFGRDGSPLLLPIDTDLAEFRELVGGAPGRYRLDPLDQRQRPVDDVPAAYLQISEPPKMTPAEDQTSVIRELVRANADMTKTIADKFAAVMQSAADLLRAADGAGLPARTVPAVETRNAVAADDDTDDDNGEPRSELAEIIKQVMPLVQLAVMRMLNGRGGGEVRNATQTPRAYDKRELGNRSGHGPAREGEPGRGERDVAVHLQAIEAALTPAEVDLVRRAMAEMAPDVLKAWAAKLCVLSVEEAVQVVRSETSKGGAK